MLEGDYGRRLVAEFIGAFALVFIGAGSVITTTLSGQMDLVAIALAHGLILAIMVSALGHISGGHFNPAVTLGFLVTKRISGALAVVYWIAQFLGGIFAALLLWAVYPDGTREETALGSPHVSDTISAGQGFLIEIILTFFLVFVVFATAVDPRGAFKYIAGLAIGLTIGADILMGGNLTGAAMNPARALGPLLVSDSWQSADWIYFIAPFIGGVIAAGLYEALYLRNKTKVAEDVQES